MADIIQMRRDTAANWTSANPTLAQGEIGLETDTLKIKVGTGATLWNALSYLVGISSIAKSSAYTITDTDGYTTIFISGNTTITLPTASKKRIIKFVKTDAGTTATLLRAGADTIAGDTTFITANQYNTCILESDGISTWYVS